MIISDYEFMLEEKRYSIVECLGSVKFTMNKDLYDEFIKRLKKYNGTKKGETLCGNVVKRNIDADNIEVTYDKYRLLLDKAGISTIDDYTICFNEKDLKRVFATNNEISVVYMNPNQGKDIGIRDIPVLYKNNEIFLNSDVIYEQLIKYANDEDYDFFIALANRFEAYKNVSEYVSNLRSTINNCRFCYTNKNEMFYASRILFNEFIKSSKDDSKVNMRCLRDFGLFIRDYGFKNDFNKSALELLKEEEKRCKEIEMIERENDRMLEDSELDRWDYEWENGVNLKLKL